MVGLLDIAPSTRTVSVGGVAVAVYGVSALGVAALLQQYPSLKNVFVGGSANIDSATLMQEAPNAIAAIIAAGTGYPGNPEAIERASQLPVAAQLGFIEAIMELTMPDGIGPLVQALTAITALLGIGSPGKAPDSKSA